MGILHLKDYSARALNTPLPFIISGFGLAIFQDVDISKYFLVKEELSDTSVPDVIKIVETWGYLPTQSGDDITYTSYSIYRPFYQEFFDISIQWLRAVYYIERSKFASRIGDYTTALGEINLSSGDTADLSSLNVEQPETEPETDTTTDDTTEDTTTDDTTDDDEVVEGDGLDYPDIDAPTIPDSWEEGTINDYYYLLNEQIEDTDFSSDIIKVTETYGYIPTATLKRGSLIAWTIPARNGLLKGSYVTSTTVPDEGELEEGSVWTFTVPSGHIFSIGDKVQLFRPYMLGSFFSASKKESAWVSVLRATDTTISISELDYDSWFNPADGVTGYILNYYLYYRSTTISSITGDVAGAYYTTFIQYDANSSDLLPNPETRFKIMLGEDETSTLTDYTEPTLMEYMERLGEIVNASDSTITQVMGNIWRVDSPKVPLQ